MQNTILKLALLLPFLLTCRNQNSIHTEAEAADTAKQVFAYPASEYITGFTFDTTRLSLGDGDNWAITWADDDKQYSFFTDGIGFGLHEEAVSTAPVVIEGTPPDIVGYDIPTETGTIPFPIAEGSAKVSGLLMAKGVLYAWIRNLNLPDMPKGTGSTMMYSTDHGKTWVWVDWNWPNIGYPSWLNAGKNYSAAPDDYAYFIAPDGQSAYADYPHIIMGRVEVSKILEKDHYRFYSGLNDSNQVIWGEYQERKPMFTDKTGCFRPDIVYNEGLDRYLLITCTPYGEWEWWANENPDRVPHLGIFEAPNPWGPWSTVYYEEEWGKPENRFAPHIPPKWISESGNELYLLYSCIPTGPYQFNIQRCYFETR